MDCVDPTVKRSWGGVMGTNFILKFQFIPFHAPSLVLYVPGLISLSSTSILSLRFCDLQFCSRLFVSVLKDETKNCEGVCLKLPFPYDHNKPTMAANTISMASLTVSCSPVVANAVQVPRLQTRSSSASISFRRHHFLTPDFHRVESARTWPRRRVGRSTARATQDDESTTQESPTSSPQPPPTPVSDKKAAAQKEIEKGQTTAIITGVISVLLGVGYLVLLQLLDTRGVNLVPPPPEAFDP